MTTIDDLISQLEELKARRGFDGRTPVLNYQRGGAKGVRATVGFARRYRRPDQEDRFDPPMADACADADLRGDIERAVVIVVGYLGPNFPRRER